MSVRSRVYRRVDRLADRWVRRGPRKVLWTQPTANLGNFLYDWMHAFTMQREGADIVCLRTPAVEPWVPVFGAASEGLLVRREDVRLRDVREKGLYNEWGVGFDADTLALFASGFIEPSGAIDVERVPADHRLTDEDLLINVRRGDYFENEAHRRDYAFDLDEYLHAALELSAATGGPIRRIHVVSDGIAWCAAHLGWLRDRCERLTFEDEGFPPATHLALLANAPRLVLTNSTFSYWGGYLSSWRHGDPAQVVAPWFHVRSALEGAAWQLDPRWTIVGDIPSGWALPEQSSEG